MTGRRAIIRAAGLAWLALMVASVIVPPMIEPTGDGFTRGLNRLGFLLLFQVGAAVLAVFLFVVARGEARRGRRWLMRLPIIWVGLVALGIIGLMLWARFHTPPGVDTLPDRPVTAPAAKPLSD